RRRKISRKPIAVGHSPRPWKSGEDEGRLHEAFLQGECVDAIERRPWEATVAVVARKGGAIEGLRVLRGAGVVVEVPGLAAWIDRVSRIAVLVVARATGALEQQRRIQRQSERHRHGVSGLVQPVARRSALRVEVGQEDALDVVVDEHGIDDGLLLPRYVRRAPRRAEGKRPQRWIRKRQGSLVADVVVAEVEPVIRQRDLSYGPGLPVVGALR